MQRVPRFFRLVLVVPGLAVAAWPLTSGSVNFGAVMFDQLSVDCMACHPERAPAARTPFDAFASEHPIGMPYPDTLSGDYRPAALVREQLELPDGRVGCTSCHDPRATEHGAVRRPQAGLCATCHDL